MAATDSSPALVVQRVDPAETPNTSEVGALAETAGYRVVDTIVVGGLTADGDSVSERSL